MIADCTIFFYCLFKLFWLDIKNVTKDSQFLSILYRWYLLTLFKTIYSIQYC